MTEHGTSPTSHGTSGDQEPRNRIAEHDLAALRAAIVDAMPGDDDTDHDYAELDVVLRAALAVAPVAVDLEELLDDALFDSDIRLHADRCPAALEQDDNECSCYVRSELRRVIQRVLEGALR